MTITQLQYFVAAAQNRSFTKAAELYYISQTAVTQQIQSLEQTVGCALFDRSTRPVSLTPAGRAFLSEAKAILMRMDTAISRAHDASSGLNGTLRIGYIKGYERSNLSNELRRFHRSLPNVLVNCYRNSSDLLAAGLLANEYDLIYTWDSTNLKQDERVKYRVIEHARLVVALYPGHPLAQRASLKRRELQGETILYMSPSMTPDSFGDAFFMNLYKNAGYKPNILFRSSDAESILMMVAAEEGISILPDYFTNKLNGADNLVFVPLDGELETEEIIAVWRQDNVNPALEALRQAFSL